MLPRLGEDPESFLKRMYDTAMENNEEEIRVAFTNTTFKDYYSAVA